MNTSCERCGHALTRSQRWHKNRFCSARCQAAAQTQPPLERLMAKVTVDNATGCWLWQGHIQANGYGQMRMTSGTEWVHRAAYRLIVGEIPEGLTLDHLCRTPLCCNPAHLEPVTNRENILRGTGASARNAVKTHCRHGHPFDESNTYIRARGGRECRMCNRLRVRALYVARKAVA